ncbi:MAG: flippase-like domain-containing protein [Deltaproteobacteria bacterium]|nr:flippase-like domain-containing protein [Deltaproteobacteria bacterium]
MQKNKKYLLFIAFLVPAILLYVCLRKFDLQLFLNELKHLKLHYFLLATLTPLGILLGLQAQWKIFLPERTQLSFLRRFEIASLFAMLVNTVPFWGGHAFVIYYLGQKEKVGKTPVLSMITLQQISDGFAKLSLFALVSFFLPFPDWMKNGMRTGMIFIVIAYFTLLLVAFRFRDRPPEETNPKGFRRLFSFIALWAHHLHALRSLKKMLAGVACSLWMKFFEGLGIYLIQKSFSLHLPIESVVLVLASLSVATMLPISPGRLGLFEATAFIIYQYLGIDSTQALALGLFIHMAHTLPFVIVGYVTSLKLGFRRQEMMLGTVPK